MPNNTRILAFAASTRIGSYNRAILDAAINGARLAGANITKIDLADFPLPIYNANLEDAEGLPENALKLKKHFEKHSGILIASPEYNSSITPLLKNTIDWVSRQADENDPPLSAYKGKIAALISASPGRLGGLRALSHLRDILHNIGTIVLPGERAISNAASLINNDGTISDEHTRKSLASVGSNLANHLKTMTTD